MRPLSLAVTSLTAPSITVRLLQVAGGVLFVASLAIGGRAYFQWFDATAPAGDPAWPAVLANLALFSAFALHHSVLARTPLKRWLHASVGPEAERSLYVIVASLLYLACTLLWQPVPGTWYALTGPWWWVGAGIQAAGVVVTVLAAGTLDLRELMGLAARRQAPDEQPTPLETRGLYGVVRHPIYFGWVLFVAGAPLMTSTRLLFAVTSIVYLAIAIPLEERSLIESFGEPYRAYQRQVRWRMVPGIY